MCIRDRSRLAEALGRYAYMLWTGGSGYVSPGGAKAREEYYVPTEFKDVKELNRIKDKLRSDISREEGELAGLKSWLSDLRSRLSGLRSEESSLSAIVSRLKGEVNQLQSRVEELRKKFSMMDPDLRKTAKQKLVSPDEVGKYIEDGWIVKFVLANGMVVMERS